MSLPTGPHGMTRTISFSARHVSIRSQLCLATCHCSGHTWGWTLSCTKTLCPIWGRNIARWSWCSASIWSCSCSLFQQRFVPSFYLKLACETSLKIVDGISIWKYTGCPKIPHLPQNFWVNPEYNFGYDAGHRSTNRSSQGLIVQKLQFNFF